MSEEEPVKKNGISWPMVVLIMATGGGNFLATQQKGNALSDEQQEGLRRIREVHAALEQFEERQKEELDKLNAALQNQTDMLNNQQQMLQHLQSTQ
jgi:hypothetical protein